MPLTVGSGTVSRSITTELKDTQLKSALELLACLVYGGPLTDICHSVLLLIIEWTYRRKWVQVFFFFPVSLGSLGFRIQLRPRLKDTLSSNCREGLKVAFLKKQNNESYPGLLVHSISQVPETHSWCTGNTLLVGAEEMNPDSIFPSACPPITFRSHVSTSVP